MESNLLFVHYKILLKFTSSSFTVTSYQTEALGLLNCLKQFVFKFLFCLVPWQIEQVKACVGDRQKFIIIRWLNENLRNQKTIDQNLANFLIK